VRVRLAQQIGGVAGDRHDLEAVLLQGVDDAGADEGLVLAHDHAQRRRAGHRPTLTDWRRAGPISGP
jgi:hypothetical protein